MTDERALARVDTATLLLSSNFDDMKQKAQLLISSGLLPKHISKPEQAIVIWLQANELGVPPMLALKEMAVINGKPACSANLMMGLVHQAYGPSSLIYRADKSNDKIAYVIVHMPDSKEVITYTFTIEEAQQAQLTGKGGPWKQYPAAMLAARAISKAARTSFPAVVGGLYVSDELGGEVHEEDLTITPSSAPAPRSVEPRKPEGIAPPSPAEEFEDEEAIDAEYTEVAEEPPLTEQQLKFIARLIKIIPEDQRFGFLATFGAQSIGTLTKAAASRTIDELKRLEAQAIDGEYTEAREKREFIPTEAEAQFIKEEQAKRKPKAQKSGDASDPTQYLAEVIEEAGVADDLGTLIFMRYNQSGSMDDLTKDQQRNLFRYLRLITQLKKASSYQALTALHERYSVKDNLWDDFAQEVHDDRLAELTPEPVTVA